MDVNHSERDHALHSPSGMKNRRLCPSFKQRDDGGENAAATEGTACHEAVEQGDAGLAPEGCEYLVAKALDFYSMLGERYPGAEWLPEERVYTHEATCWGTGDLLGYDPATSTIIVADLKFGRNYVDPAGENDQLECYAVGAWNKYPGADNCDVWLYNPRRNETSDHRYTSSDLQDLQDKITNTITNAVENDGKITNANQSCGLCAHAATCPAAKTMLIEPVTSTSVALPDQMDASLMTATELTAALEAEKTIVKVVEQWSKALKAEARERLETGGEIEGWSMKTRKARVIVEEPDEVLTVARESGVSEEQIEKAVAVDVGLLRKAVYANADKGDKKKAEEAFLSTCKSEGFLTQGSYDYLAKEK